MIGVEKLTQVIETDNQFRQIYMYHFLFFYFVEHRELLGVCVWCSRQITAFDKAHYCRVALLLLVQAPTP